MKKRINYYYLPQEYWKKHDYCEFLINQVEDLLLNKVFKDLNTQTITFPDEFMEALQDIDDEQNHIFDFLEKHKFNDELTHIVRCHLLSALIRETCYSIQESLLCSLKMRLTVSFTLLRKPFLEILIVLMRMLNETDFIEKFNYQDNFDPIKTTPEQKRRLIANTNKFFFEKYNCEDLFECIFDKDEIESIFNITNNAIHLFTDRNPKNKTEKQNLNFIFSDYQNTDSQWEYIYFTLPMILNFLTDLIDLLVLKCTPVEQKVFTLRMQKRDRLRRLNNVC
ncbi:hypothetical protein ACFSJW_08570 [Flavobacterium artemisiae]|uniref:Uncharacterized protein n=1 Tax=Flavobacterium artemisiae TaxID=2126556 RepID=A0ABW4HF40_9FLAO